MDDMAQGYSIHIGLNHVDTSSPDYADVTVPVLAGCLNDANSMEALAQAQGFQEVAKLTDDQATAEHVLGAIHEAAGKLDSEDILLLTYSGHGSQVPDQNGDEPDGKDETWVLYDRQLTDDELAVAWTEFKEGARIVVLSDSCHSGSVERVIYETITPGARRRTLEREQSEKAAKRFEELHPDRLTMRVVRDDDVPATVLLISGCQDNQTSQDGDRNGLFTEKLLDVWNDGAFEGSYKAFWKQILSKMPPTQSPNYAVSGHSDPAFEEQRPFTV